MPHPRAGIRPSLVPTGMFPACELGAKPIISFGVKAVFFPQLPVLRGVICGVDLLCNAGSCLLLRVAGVGGSWAGTGGVSWIPSLIASLIGFEFELFFGSALLPVMSGERVVGAL